MQTMDLLDSSSTLTAEALAAIGFDVDRLRFYAWLVAHGRDPEWEPPRRAADSVKDEQ